MISECIVWIPLELTDSNWDSNSRRQGESMNLHVFLFCVIIHCMHK